MKISSTPVKGQTGADVKALQAALKGKGFDPGAIDGIFGSKTEKAVSKFQKSIGLPGSGVIGPKTLAGLGLELGDVVQPGAPITTGMDPDEGTQPWYRRMWAAIAFDPGFEDRVANSARVVLKGKERYAAVAQKVFKDCFMTDANGVKHAVLGSDLWWVIGLIHMKEASCNFAGVLHNGERIIGTGKKTSIVPIGRGPFSTWEEAAVDALNGESLGKLKDFEIGELFRAIERYNGTGYITGAGKTENSPYLWALSNINDDKGKYVSDGKWDANASTQSAAGFATMLKWLVDNAGVVVVTKGAAVPAPVKPSQPKVPSKLTRALVADKIVEIINRDIAAKLRETHGKNRSPRIDSFNKRAGVPMGSPYCASAGTCAIADAVAELSEVLGVKLKNPVRITAASQDLRRTSFVPAKYIRKEGSLGKKGDVGVLQTISDSSRGHYVTLSKDQESQPTFDTVEYNTDSGGSRDGDGAYARVRSTVDGSRANAGKLFICFTDVPQWVVDVNS